ncbi:hypothetical protein NQ318_003582 [Aromia moschata]|uniref:Uncharacterized protein n=1 Tax=Aromia moschata TaxID=1265417 RepID=A0AAV8YVH3_9CUCU|nr:hypothetical protein NQ318_003582 [Aromia moschata]
MTSQNSSFTQRYQPYIFDQYRQPDGQWDSTTANPPTVPARGVKGSLQVKSPVLMKNPLGWLHKIYLNKWITMLYTNAIYS